MKINNLIQSFIDLNVNNKEIKGAVLLGSVAYSSNDARSDIDITVIYDEKAPKVEIPQSEIKWDVSFMEKKVFENLKEPDWRIYAFLVSRVIIDNTGCIKEQVEKLRTVEKNEIQELTAATLDGYLNGFYRTMKALRRGDKLGANLELAIGMRFLIKSLFYMNGLIAPYEDRLKMVVGLLEKNPYEGELLLIRLEESLLSLDQKVNSKLFLDIESFYRKQGYGEVYDEWDSSLTDELIF